MRKIVVIMITIFVVISSLVAKADMSDKWVNSVYYPKIKKEVEQWVNKLYGNELETMKILIYVHFFRIIHKNIPVCQNYIHSLMKLENIKNDNLTEQDKKIIEEQRHACVLSIEKFLQEAGGSK